MFNATNQGFLVCGIINMYFIPNVVLFFWLGIRIGFWRQGRFGADRNPLKHIVRKSFFTKLQKKHLVSWKVAFQKSKISIRNMRSFFRKRKKHMPSIE